MEYFYIYEIEIAGKYYIGQHRTYNINDRYMGSGKKLWEYYNKYGIQNAQKTILSIVNNQSYCDILEKFFIKSYREEFGNENILNISSGGKHNSDIYLYTSSEAHTRNIENLKRYWAENKDSEKVLLRNKKISEKMKGNKNGMGHSHLHTEKTKKLISEKVKLSNPIRGPKLAKASSKRIFIYKDGKKLEKENVKNSWKELGFTSETVAQRFIRYCTELISNNQVVNFNYKFNFFVSYKDFEISEIDFLFKEVTPNVLSDN